jgi:HK97 family phage prohead protease
MTQNLNIRASDDGKSYIIEGYMVVFDNVDLYGTRFTKNTDFWESTTSDTPPLMYDHAMDSKLGLQMIGQVTKKKTDEVGIWFEAQLDKANKFAEAIATMVRSGKMGVSTGTSPHMMSMDGDVISSWPILEVSLTPTPAEPDTIEHLSQRKWEEAVENLNVALEAVKALSSKREPAASDTDDDSSASLTEGLDAKTLGIQIDIEQHKRSRSAVAYR